MCEVAGSADGRQRKTLKVSFWPQSWHQDVTPMHHDAWTRHARESSSDPDLDAQKVGGQAILVVDRL
ncbi:hypothetical protein DBL06_03100 [Agrobacterium pusense]|nr:hypothetical protein DBL06_02985 [Agrobacterium pusense]PTV77283.1 hypothetical protein DBL06_03100 [Agrobacterium pusense]